MTSTAAASESEDDGLPDFDISTVPTHRVRYRIEGTSPLLMHAMTPKQVEEILIRGDRPGKDPTASLEKLAEAGLYLVPEDHEDEKLRGKIAMPGLVMFAVCKAAGRQIKLQGVGKLSTAKTTMLNAFIDLLDDWHEVVAPASPGWRPHLARGMLAGTTAVGIVRPEFREWELEGTMIVREHSGFNLPKAFQLLDVAGERHGIGSWRPSKNGRYGTFKVTGFECQRIAVRARTTFDKVAVILPPEPGAMGAEAK